jgi:hypothetical protein
MGTIKDNHEVVFPQEDVGYLGGTTRSYIARYWSELSMPDQEATFEQLPYIFQAGIQTATASADGTGSGYIWIWDPATTAQNTTSTYTIEGGDDQQAEEFDYAFVKSFTLSGEGMGAMMLSAEWVGREATNSTFTTTGISLPTVEEIIVNNGTLFIDSVTGTIGSTQVSNTLFGFSLDWTTGLQEYWAVDGSKDFSITKFTSDEIVLSMTYEHNASAVAQKALYRAGTPRQFRLKFTGADLATTGAAYAVKTMIIDLVGVYEDWSALDDNDGNDVVEATVRCRYDSTATLKGQITIVNELATLP